MSIKKNVEEIFCANRSINNYPRTVNALKILGIYNYAYYVASGDTLFLTLDNEIELIYGRSDTQYPIVASGTKRDMLIDALKTYQAGQISYPALCQQAAKAGVNCWLVDLR